MPSGLKGLTWKIHIELLLAKLFLNNFFIENNNTKVFITRLSLA